MCRKPAQRRRAAQFTKCTKDSATTQREAVERVAAKDAAAEDAMKEMGATVWAADGPRYAPCQPSVLQ